MKLRLTDATSVAASRAGISTADARRIEEGLRRMALR
jgi:hypothetical protein